MPLSFRRPMLVLLAIMATFAASAVELRAARGREFFALDNGVGRGSWAPEAQAAVLRNLGYDGISYFYTNADDLARGLAAFDAVGLRVFALYAMVDISAADPLPPGLPDAINLLRGRDTIIWLPVRGLKTAGDEAAAAVVSRVAALAAEAGLQVALYGHHDFYLETAEDCVRLIRQLRIGNVRTTINLCHELRSGNAARLTEVIRTCAPHTVLVTINGAEPDGTILRLDQGSVDISDFLAELNDAGFSGAVGLQLWGVPGDIHDNLEKSIAAWQALNRPGAAPANGS
jgi:sugar phosphate isomerase/epimerase